MNVDGDAGAGSHRETGVDYPASRTPHDPVQEPLTDSEQSGRKVSFKFSSEGIAKYSGIGFQLLACIAIFTWAGNAADHALNHFVPWLTALLSLTGVCLGLYLVIKQMGR